MGRNIKIGRKGPTHKFQLAVIGNPSRVSGWRLTSKGGAACSFGSTGGGFCEWPLLWKRHMELSARFPSLKHTAIYFPPSAQQMVRPFSPERETCYMLSVRATFVFLPLFKKAFSFTPAILTGLHCPKNLIRFLLSQSLQGFADSNPQDLHRQRTCSSWLCPFSPERSFVEYSFLLFIFSILNV